MAQVKNEFAVRKHTNYEETGLQYSQTHIHPHVPVSNIQLTSHTDDACPQPIIVTHMPPRRRPSLTAWISTQVVAIMERERETQEAERVGRKEATIEG